MLIMREYVLDTIKRLPDGAPELFDLFCQCLRINGRNYLSYRTARFRYLDRQGKLFGRTAPALRPRDADRVRR